MQPTTPNANTGRSPGPIELDMRAKLLDVLYTQRVGRQQLRRKIHDDIGQYLTSISINASLLARNCNQAREKELVAAITSASKMACRSTHDLANLLGPDGVYSQDAIEPGLRDLASYYDIDDTRPKINFLNNETADNVPQPLVEKICSLFEQFLLLFLPTYQAVEYVVSLSTPGKASNPSSFRLNLLAKGDPMRDSRPATEPQQLLLQQRTQIRNLRLSTETSGPLRQLQLRAEFSAEHYQPPAPETVPMKGGRVLVVDDHPFVRTGLRAALQEFWPGAVAESSSMEDAYRQFLADSPVLVITDISLPGANGIELVRRIKARTAATRVIVLSMFSDSQTVSRVMDAGADGYLAKASAGHCLESAVRTIMRGQNYIDPDTSMIFATNTLGGKATLDVLSPREFQIFVALANASSIRKIAENYHISVNTVGNHKRSILRKLKLKSVAEMTLMAVKEGLIVDADNS